MRVICAAGEVGYAAATQSPILKTTLTVVGEVWIFALVGSG
jgi:hypothetical protein